MKERKIVESIGKESKRSNGNKRETKESLTYNKKCKERKKERMKERMKERKNERKKERKNERKKNCREDWKRK